MQAKTGKFVSAALSGLFAGGVLSALWQVALYPDSYWLSTIIKMVAATVALLIVTVSRHREFHNPLLWQAPHIQIALVGLLVSVAAPFYFWTTGETSFALDTAIVLATISFLSFMVVLLTNTDQTDESQEALE